MEEITIVTAFFNIGREKWKDFNRDDNDYIRYFRFWARIQNRLIVYTESAMKDIVLQIRAEYGLADRTEVIVLDDIQSLDIEVFDAMQQALSRPEAVNYRVEPNHPEAYNAKYNYVMYLKPLIISDAIQRKMADGMIAWLDFGFNHGGEYYNQSMDFDFLWKANLTDKIHFFAMHPLDERPVFDIIRSLDTYIAGAIMIAPANLWPVLLELYRGAAMSLADCGFSDDDQTLAVMAYRKKSEIFAVHEVTGFFDGLELTTDHVFHKQAEKTHKLSKQKAKAAWEKGSFKEALQNYSQYISQKLHGD